MKIKEFYSLETYKKSRLSGCNSGTTTVIRGGNHPAGGRQHTQWALWTTYAGGRHQYMLTSNPLKGTMSAGCGFPRSEDRRTPAGRRLDQEKA